VLPEGVTGTGRQRYPVGDYCVPGWCGPLGSGAGEGVTAPVQFVSRVDSEEQSTAGAQPGQGILAAIFLVTFAGMATLRDVAKRVGVSVSTVSRALNDHPHVSAQLRARIADVAAELDYHPNALARGLRRNQTRTVGLIVPNLLNNSYSSAAAVLQGLLQKFGYGLSVHVSDNDPETERRCFDKLREYQVDGLVHIPSAPVSTAHLVRDWPKPFPIVEMFRRSSREIDAVVYDEDTGAYEVVSHLTELGHVRIGMIVGPREYSSTKKRMRGARRAMADGGLDPGDLSIVHQEYASEGGKQACHRLLDSAAKPTAIFAASMQFVLGSLVACSELGVVIPDDVSLAGLGNTQWYDVVTPTITTYTVPLREMGLTAAQLLISRIEEQPPVDETRPTEIVVAGKFVPRGSTGPPG